MVLSNLTFGRVEKQDENREEKRNPSNWEEVIQSRVTVAMAFLCSLQETYNRLISFYEQMRSDLRNHGQSIQQASKGNVSTIWLYLRKNPSASSKAMKLFSSLSSLKTEEMAQTFLRSTRSLQKGIHFYIFDALFSSIREEFHCIDTLNVWSSIPQVLNSFFLPISPSICAPFTFIFSSLVFSSFAFGMVGEWAGRQH
jgi:hypothetical protein